MRFRDGGEEAVAADIKDFFHEVYVDEKDAAAFRYWWFIDGKMVEVSQKERKAQDAWRRLRCVIT